jgi:carboxypeptidase Taq
VSVAGAPPELSALKTRMAELYDIGGALRVLSWDQSVTMPPAGAEPRAEALSTLERLAHDRFVDPEVGKLLYGLESYAAGLDPESDDARLLDRVQRDYDKAVRVPSDLAAEMAHAAAMGEVAWMRAREADDFSLMRDALAHQIELRHRYAACFPEAAHPYDVLLDDFEEDATVAELRPLFTELRERLAVLVRRAADHDAPANGRLFGPFPLEAQRPAVQTILEAVGFDPARFRLDDSAHPFSQSPALGDHRMTTRWREDDLTYALHSALHEFGHALYEAGIDPGLGRGPLMQAVSLGVHESQSRIWENQIGRSREFCAWALPVLRAALHGPLDTATPDALFRALNGVSPSLVRTESDETTYNLHIALRFDLEVRLLEGDLSVDDLPAAFAEGLHDLLGVEPPSAVLGVLQDIHWAIGLVGYFPTYTLGNLMSAQLWEAASDDVPDLSSAIEQGDFAPLREWLREHVHRHGRRWPPRELLRRATGQELSVEPFLAYLAAKLADSGAIPAAA